MPSIDLRYIQCAKYNYNSEAKTRSYTDRFSIGDAMKVNLALKFAEARLYAEGSLAEYIKRATGGTISIATKYIPVDAQVKMYGATQKTRTIGSKQVSSLAFGATDVANYLGVSCYAPDIIDGTEKYTAIFVSKAMFGPPNWNYETMGQNIVFQTPTTTGEFLPDPAAGNKVMLEFAIVDTDEEAMAWCDAVLEESEAA